jgi:pyruvate,orthophosphate dikinase
MARKKELMENIRKYVYLFNEYDEVMAQLDENWDAVRGLLGGKGANLLDATRLGIPVPPGFTVTTVGCNAYLAAGERFPDGLWEQALAAIADLERQTGKQFGSIENPLLVSCRSGARFSMPGMMDTILNIGLNDEIAAKLATRTHRPRFAYDLYRRLVQMFGGVVMGVPDEVFEAVITAQRRESGARNDAELDAKAWQAVTLRFKEIIRTYTGRPVKPCSAPGTASAPSTIARQPASRTTSARRSTSRPWCSATSATIRPPACSCRATRPPANRCWKATT